MSEKSHLDAVIHRIEDLLLVLKRPKPSRYDFVVAARLVRELQTDIATLKPSWDRIVYKANQWDRIPIERMHAVAHASGFLAGDDVLGAVLQVAEQTVALHKRTARARYRQG